MGARAAQCRTNRIEIGGPPERVEYERGGAMKGPGVAPASRSRTSIAIASVVALGLAVTSLTAVALVGRTADPAAAFPPGENGQPTSGNHTDLKGRAGDVTF